MSEEIIEEFDLSDEGEDEAKNFAPLATFGKGKNTVPGSICGIVIGDTDSPYAENGLVHIPAGQISNVPNADTVSGIYGLVGKAEFKALQGKKPTFTNGDLNIPLAQAPTGACDGTVDDDTPGGIVGIGYSEDGVFSIKDGFARIPRPPEPGYFPKGVYNGVMGQKVDWTAMGTGVIPLTGKENPKDGDLRIVTMLIGGYLSLWFQTYNAEKKQWED